MLFRSPTNSVFAAALGRFSQSLKQASFALATAVPSMNTLQVPPNIIQKWQEIVDLLAEVLSVPSALIMKVEPPNIRVFLRSASEGNPYHRDELASLNTGLYCETVMNTRRLLLVPDALSDREWNANPDIKLGMISYMEIGRASCRERV